MQLADLKNAGCSRSNNVVTIRLEMNTLAAATALFAALAADIDAGNLPVSVRTQEASK